MSDPMHDLDVTVWVGKNGIDAVSEELSEQLDDRDAVKVKFLRAARAEGDTEVLAGDLAEAANGTVLDTRGHTAVIQR
ncbi:YhbY family RNA-binding protein [Halorhabdus rudnickae]|uniref:YhbY family RNA-binding protein n=1 Tax=Halorhabdus rudnickae TaxID=1775544 RepID=UPI00108343B6|nr:YhbY family RNA-binding protein [Halorhabdus rudnickae]